ncbi:hypothetical protein PTSG_07690 [Salpingoeca rosetta]|uniref:Uncharacterized protein n=1 Tax=Salpingoeca rosetta (strain ATCC 50818 / BSB-021) TaxID=946362 RepID=F2UHH4_SALR5|nr:uncharacterized protein PTSG_07690 [Salpingoeca rosetta]EGD76573.1 hypothetical protein PTSG_07690 [Salpingoeca rosetta]|eukprot:XP_004991487.1 hypothetical protein PTSG_07690 [Salpingoeca rosetta]
MTSTAGRGGGGLGTPASVTGAGVSSSTSPHPPAPLHLQGAAQPVEVVVVEKYVVRRLVAGIGVVVGIAGAVAFGANFGHRWQPVSLAILQGIVALLNYLVAHHRSSRAKQRRQPEPYHRGLKLVGLVAFLLGLFALVAGLGMAIEEKQKLTGSSSYIDAVWGFLLAKWGIISWVFAEHLNLLDAKRQTAYTPLIARPADV